MRLYWYHGYGQDKSPLARSAAVDQNLGTAHCSLAAAAALD